jgi:octaprenyl-diphosphate synthase
MTTQPAVDTNVLAVEQEIAAALERVEVLFGRQLASDLPNVAELCEQIARYRGKMVRPRLVITTGLATAGMAGNGLGVGLGDGGENGAVTDEHVILATVCEIVHMATLVHDDVLDEADTRRRGRTINRLRGNEPAVMLGDYLIAAAYHLCSTANQREASLLVGRAAMVMCEGELLQLHHREDYSLDLATYEEIVTRKTGALIGLAARLGALASGAPSDVQDRLERFGVELGIAFQIQDDVLDLTSTTGMLGKSAGKDLDKAKLTLPLIHHLEVVGPRGRGETLNVLASATEGDGRAIERVKRALDETDSIAFARAEAAGHVDAARAEIEPLPETAAKRHLELAAMAAVSRDH